MRTDRAALIALLALALALGPTLAPAPASADAGARAAGHAAERRYGGRVLKVERREDRYRVKLLLPSGRVKVVGIDLPGSGPGGAETGKEGRQETPAQERRPGPKTPGRGHEHGGRR